MFFEKILKNFYIYAYILVIYTIIHYFVNIKCIYMHLRANVYAKGAVSKRPLPCKSNICL